MKYLIEYLKNNGKFEALKSDKTTLEHYIGSVLSVDKNIITSRILSEKKEYKPDKGSLIELIVHTPKGVYSIECKVLKELENGWEFSFPKSARLSQRREFLRVEIETPIKVKYTLDGVEKEIESNTKDVCAGGVAFDTDSKMQDESDIEVEFEIKGRKITSKGKIVYSVQMQWQSSFRTGVIMTSLNSDDTIYIIDFCSEYIGRA